MKSRLSAILSAYTFHVTGWVLAALMYSGIRFVGLEDLEDYAGVDLTSVDQWFAVERTLFMGFLVGLTFGTIDVVVENSRARAFPYGKLIVLQAVVKLSLCLILLGGVRAYGISQLDAPFDFDLWVSRVFSDNALVVLSYVAVVSILLSFIRQVDRKFGPGNLVRLLLGRYHRPREEQRIFQFLDLQGSTTHAERLGHVRYSRLIQDCFRDLAVVVQDHAEVYQYVGDEAVLCWKAQAGLDAGACLSAYFHFQDELESRAAHYEAEYGVVPIFKAGLNIGRVTVAEVGEIKREIAFHGDVLNTAARIQAKCNEFGERVLVSAYLKDALGDVAGYEFSHLGEVSLRGRAQSVEIFGVTRSS